MRIKCTIEGVSPLLMNAFREESLTTEGRKQSKNSTPRELADLAKYAMEDGELFIPGRCIFSAIIAAGKFHKSGKNKVTTQKSSLIPAGITMLTEYCKLGTKDYEVDSCSVVVPATGGRIMAYRPRLDKWECMFELEVDKTMFGWKEVRAFIDDAGSKCGVLAYRPSCKGWYGKFKVKNWDVKE